MDLQKALARNLVLRTEYGAGPKALGGLFERKTFNRRRYMLDGGTVDDIIYENTLAFGPVSLLHRSAEQNPLNAKDFELAISLFKLFAVYTNDKDLFIKVKPGINAGALRMILSLMPPAGLLAGVIDIGVAARAGFRLNVSGLIRDIQNGQDDSQDLPEAPDFS